MARHAVAQASTTKRAGAATTPSATVGLVPFNNKTRQTPDRYIELAEDRLKDWRARREKFEERK